MSAGWQLLHPSSWAGALHGTFARLRASGAEVVQEPAEQPYGVRDCAFLDPAGNLIRINDAALSHPAIAAMTCTDGTVRR